MAAGRVTTPPGATAYKVQFSPKHSPGYTHVGSLTDESASKASELLMLNHAKYHTLFNEVGLHNHIVHQLCSLWALGATPEQIQAAYDLNTRYQVPHYPHNAAGWVKMRDPAVFKEHLGKSESYTDYLHFFQDKITSRGVEEVVREYLFNGDEQADDLLGRLYSGFEHPILHLGFGLEFQQPCLVAEALASAAIHDTWPLPIVLPTEAYLKAHPNTQQTSLVSLLPALQSIPVIASAVKSSKHPDRVIPFMKHAGDALPPLLSQWRVEPTEEDIKYRTAEMANVCAYMIGAAQHPRKKPAIEFFMMHSMNLSAFFGVFMQAQWLTLKQRARLLTWKGWMDLALYAANACPTLYPERIATYVPKQPGGWDMIVARVNRYPDDGHTCKLIRALLNARNLSALYSAEGRSELPLREEDFLAVAHMAMDSVERMLEPGYKMPDHLIQLYRGVLGVDEEVVKIVARFVRWCGSEDSWEGFPDLPSAEEEKAKL